MMKSSAFCLAATLGVSAGCGGVVDPPSEVDGGQSPNDAAIDAPIDAPAPPCDLSAPFGPPTRLEGINGPNNEWGVWVSPDQRTAVIGSDRPSGDNDFYLASRGAPSAAFDTPVRLENVSTSGAADGGPSLPADGLTMYFHSDRAGSHGSYDIFTSTRSSTAASFGPPSLVARINDGGLQEFPFVTGDGSRLYFSSDKDIVVSTRDSSGAFGVATPVAAVNTLGNETAPVLTPDERTIYFARHIGDDPAAIMRATRTTTADGFGEPQIVAELETPGVDFPQAVSADGCTLYFTSNGQPGSQGMDVYAASRP
jgi:Tol biopolymer transport system component